MAFAEAIAHGLPVIGAAGGAVPETIPPGAGLLAPPDDVAAFAHAMRRLMADAEERQRLAAAARAAAAALPTWEETAQAFSRALGGGAELDPSPSSGPSGHLPEANAQHSSAPASGRRELCGAGSPSPACGRGGWAPTKLRMP